MAGKLQSVSQLADRTAHGVTQDAGSWKRYLDSASRLYKYSFENQLLIYAQRPDATACAAMKLWNEKMHRWVKAGSKGIVLIRENGNGKPRLEYVFDVSDTRPMRGARMPYLWEMREEHHPAVLAALEEQYGVGSQQDLGSRLMETVAGIVEETYPEYLRDLSYDTEGSFLEELDDLNREVCFRDTLTASVQYTLLTRCGLNASDYLENEDLRGIMEFSTPAVLHHLGDATSALSMGILQEIGRTIRSFDREQYNERQKKAEKPIEKATDIGYTGDADSFSTVKCKSNERRIENGRTDIQEERGLSDTRSGDGRGGRKVGGHVREVRASEADLPEGTPPRDVYIDAADGEAHAAPETDRRTGAGAGRPDGSRNDETERSGRGSEGTRSDGVGAGGQLLHGAGRRSGAEGDRLSVNSEGTGQEESEGQPDKEGQETAGAEPAVSASGEKESREPQYFQFALFTTVEEQVGRIAQAQEEEKQAKKAAPTVGRTAPQVTDAVIGCALTSGGNEKGSVLRIVAFYQKSPDMERATAFLAEEYGTGGKGLTIGGREYALWFDREGIRIAPGRTANIPSATLVSWEKAAEMVSWLLEEGTYASQEVLDSAGKNEYRELAEKLWHLRQDLSEEGKKLNALPFLSELYNGFPGFPDSTEKIAECLSEPESRGRLLSEVESFSRRYTGDRGLLRSHFHDSSGLAARVALLSLESKEFHAMENFAPARASFITEDEIDHMLTGGSDISEGKMRIYSYFVQGHDAKERAAFLQDEYGTGGRGYIGYDEWHDSKGIKLTRSDEISGYEGYDSIRLNWNKVQKRIGQLIASGRYLTSKELAYTAQYEKIQLARNIVTFYSCLPGLGAHLSPFDRSYDEAQKQILTALGDPEESAAMYEDMAKRFALVAPDERNYHLMQRAIDNMGAYQRGEYSLFTPLSAEVLQEQRQKKETTKKSSPQKEPEPLDELEAAARALAKKQRQKVKEESDGQLSFDFSANVPEETVPENSEQEPDGQETEEPNAEGQMQEKRETLRQDEEETIRSRYDLGYGYMGNGLTVWNRLENVNGDYKTVAHIGADRNVDFLDDNLPEIIKEQIQQIADTAELTISATQDTLVFTEPPKKEPDRTKGQETEEERTAEPAAQLYRGTLITLTDVIRQSSFYDYLRDRETDYDRAERELNSALSYFIEEIADSQPELYEAFHSLPMFREWMVEDILLSIYDDVRIDKRDALLRYAGEPDFPEWAVETEKREQPTAENPGQEPAAKELLFQEPETGQTEEPALVTEKAQESAHIEPVEPDLIPNVEEYLNLKTQYPDKLVGVKVGGYYLFYGEDAKTAASALGTKLEIREIPGLGETTVTSGGTWQSVLKNLLEHGHSTVIAGQDPEFGEAAPYQIRKERDIADYIPLGMQLTIDGRRMEIDSIDYANGHVSLRDLEMQGWFPIFRQETVSFVRDCVEQEWERTGLAADDILEAAGEKPQAQPPEPEAQEEPPEMVEIEGGTIGEDDSLLFTSPRLPYDIVIQKLPVGPERSNFHITDDGLGTGGQKAKYQDNVAAIRTLKQMEAENHLATPREQEILSHYVGWGGLAQAFDPANEKWGKEYAELKELLTPEEYASAQGTVLNAHYTSPTVIKAMYEAVNRMDFTPGNILEPSCGIGNFFGLVPEGYNKANLYGVELDQLTGRIAGQLYQRAHIAISGFEDIEHPDDFFDLAVGNVPFGEYKVHDRRYDRQNLLIHDYFLTKSLDKLRPGGIAAFITTKGTMDKLGSKAREGLAQKADLLGAIRLPNTTFKANAGTSVTTDILFFQKRGSAPEKLPDWVNIGQTEDGVPLNNYFLQHPEMVLGKMAFYENMYGNATETACLPIEGADLKEQLAEAIRHIAPPDRELLHMDAPESEAWERSETIPADPDVRNFSFTEKDGKLYFRENSRMKLAEPGKTQAARIRGMIGIRDSTRKLINLQTNGADEEAIQAEQAQLNRLYDQFQEKYGLLNSAGNRLAFRQDSSYPLLCSLEVLDGEGNLKRKADMFSKRTIQHRKPVTSVDTAVEALGVSIGERACVDLTFMASLMGGADKIPQIVSDLKGIIFKTPESGPFDMDSADWCKGWQAADEYLSGNVRQKLATARAAAKHYPEFAVNVEELEKVQPKDLTAPEISVRIGSPWIDTRYYKQFMFELLQTPRHLQKKKINIVYSDVSGEWNVLGKSEDSQTNTRVWNTYGTKRINAYAILEASLNQRSVQIFDIHCDADGKETRVLNERETAIAQQKQEAVKEAFQNWIFKDPHRRADLCAIYNRMFNSMRPREYDGQHIHFTGMNPEIHMERHQRNAVARVLYGGNSLLAHVVGAGKTYEMVAAAMESKRLGLCRKSMIVVPNHLTEQWGSDFLTLYPGAKVLVATKKDFEPKNRKKFCARIATGDYDAVIIGHSQFERIPISPERQKAIIEEQIGEIVDAITEAKASKDEKFTIKQMERTKKGLAAELKKLHDQKKDDTVYFEELGIDRLFVDEAHSFKNLYMHTKMRNVAGISQTKAQKSSDMFAKCRYMDEITGRRGIIFATGTPVSNSMVELYTMMRYLQFNMLEHGYEDSTGRTRSLKHFDNWAATFGEQVTAVELKPEGYTFSRR